jgi:hypothetical protein
MGAGVRVSRPCAGGVVPALRLDAPRRHMDDLAIVGDTHVVSGPDPEKVRRQSASDGLRDDEELSGRRRRSSTTTGATARTAGRRTRWWHCAIRFTKGGRQRSESRPSTIPLASRTRPATSSGSRTRSPGLLSHLPGAVRNRSSVSTSSASRRAACGMPICSVHRPRSWPGIVLDSLSASPGSDAAGGADCDGAKEGGPVAGGVGQRPAPTREK